MRLRELRNANGLTQNDLAKMLNVSGQTILNWENGIYEPKINQLIELSKIFNVSIDYLVENDVNNTGLVIETIEKIPQENFVDFIRKELDKINIK